MNSNTIHTCHTESLRIRNPATFSLVEMPTAVSAPYRTREDYRQQMWQYRRQLRRLQRQLQARADHALLVIVQGMDAAGKNGLIRRVFGGLDPVGLHVWSFGPPSEQEQYEDYLRRYQRLLPARGEIAVFNRSYYEMTLSTRVHPEWLTAQGCDAERAADPDFWNTLYEDIRQFEQYLMNNRIVLIKLMPHVSARTQRRRLLRRLRTLSRQWKLTTLDGEDSSRWPEFLNVYSDCLKATSTPLAPWYVLPGDDKRTARLMAAEVVLQAMQSMNPGWPKPDKNRQMELAEIKKRLSSR